MRGIGLGGKGAGSPLQGPSITNSPCPGYVKLEGEQLNVTLRRFTDREIDYAVRHLCEDLNNMQPVTLDRFHFSIRYRVL